MSDALNMVKIAKKALEDKKAQNIKIIDIRQVTVIADYFLIADGANPSTAVRWWIMWRKPWERPVMSAARSRATAPGDGC